MYFDETITGSMVASDTDLLTRYLPLLEAHLSRLPTPERLRVLQEYAFVTRNTQYELIVRFLPLSVCELIDILRACIAEHNSYHSSHTVITVCLTRSRRLQKSGQPEQAAEAALAIILVVEALPEVGVCHSLLQEASSLLRELVM